MKWQAIETAPKDGTEILGYCAIDGIILVYWKSSGWEYSWGYSNLEPKLTHWMPLPEPPIE
jgi:Protein of unknown function (DUF551)